MCINRLHADAGRERAVGALGSFPIVVPTLELCCTAHHFNSPETTCDKWLLPSVCARAQILTLWNRINKQKRFGFLASPDSWFDFWTFRVYFFTSSIESIYGKDIFTFSQGKYPGCVIVSYFGIYLYSIQHLNWKLVLYLLHYYVEASFSHIYSVMEWIFVSCCD